MSARDVILDAVVRVLVETGLEGLSVRQVAVEAHVSLGAVQHHFPTKDALLQAAMDHVTRQFRENAEGIAQSATDDRVAFARFCLLLGCATGDRDDAITWLWFAAKSTSTPSIAQTHRDAWQETEDYLSSAIAQLYPALSPEIEAASLLALLDGIATTRATEPNRMPATRAAQIINHYLTRLDRNNTQMRDSATRSSLVR